MRHAGRDQQHPVGNVTTLLAGLVLSETATAGQGGFLPLASATNSNNIGFGSGALTFGPLPVDANGTATAVWEILTANPNAFETAEFGVFYSYTGNPATNTPPTFSGRNRQHELRADVLQPDGQRSDPAVHAGVDVDHVGLCGPLPDYAPVSVRERDRRV
jgi:hypothetical protein